MDRCYRHFKSRMSVSVRPFIESVQRYDENLFKDPIRDTKISAYVAGERIHIMGVSYGKKMVLFLGYFNNTELDCANARVSLTDIVFEKEVFIFRVELKSSTGQSFEIQGKHFKSCTTSRYYVKV